MEESPNKHLIINIYDDNKPKNKYGSSDKKRDNTTTNNDTNSIEIIIDRLTRAGEDDKTHILEPIIDDSMNQQLDQQNQQNHQSQVLLNQGLTQHQEDQEDRNIENVKMEDYKVEHVGTLQSCKVQMRYFERRVGKENYGNEKGCCVDMDGGNSENWRSGRQGIELEHALPQEKKQATEGDDPEIIIIEKDLYEENKFLEPENQEINLVDGEKELDNGLDRLDNSLERLSNGIEGLENSERRLDNGLGRLYNGETSLENGQERLENSEERFDKGERRLENNEERLSNHEENLDSMEAPPEDHATSVKKLNCDSEIIHNDVDSGNIEVLGINCLSPNSKPHTKNNNRHRMHELREKRASPKKEKGVNEQRKQEKLVINTIQEVDEDLNKSVEGKGKGKEKRKLDEEKKIVEAEDVPSLSLSLSLSSIGMIADKNMSKNIIKEANTSIEKRPIDEVVHPLGVSLSSSLPLSSSVSVFEGKKNPVEMQNMPASIDIEKNPQNPNQNLLNNDIINNDPSLKLSIIIHDKKETKENMFECEICCNDCSLTDKIQLNDNENHPLCRDCFMIYLHTEINENKVNDLKCPHCMKLLSEENIKVYTNEVLYTKYKKYLKNQEIIKNPLLRWCPNAPCENVVKLAHKDDLIAKCDKCQCFLCTRCNNKYHGNTTCDQFLMQEFKHWAQDKEIGKCPVCRSIGYKESGCNHMTCQVCHYEYCWICNGPYTRSHFSIFNIFGCPGLKADRKGKLFRKYGCIARILLRLLILLVIILLLPFAIVLGFPMFLLSLIIDWYGKYKFRRMNFCGKFLFVTNGLILGMILNPLILAIGAICLVPFMVGIGINYMNQVYKNKKRARRLLKEIKLKNKSKAGV